MDTRLDIEFYSNIILNIYYFLSYNPKTKKIKVSIDCTELNNFKWNFST